MSTKSSNRVSLAIAVLAILLILGGVFLLNQSFNGSSAAGVRTSQEEETGSLQDRYTVNSADTLEEESSNDTAGKFPTETAQEATPTNTTVVETPDAREPMDSATDNAPTSTSQTSPSTESTPEEPEETQEEAEPTQEPAEEEMERVDASNLDMNQFTAEITNISGNQYTLRLTGCGLPNALYCKAGTVLQLYSLTNFTSDAIETGNQYRFTGRFSEDNSGMFIGSLSGMDRV